jgi:hypothetical protein
MHELELRDGQAAFYSLRETAWHRLGHVSDEAKSFDEALELADMVYTYKKDPLYATSLHPNGVEIIDVPDKYSVTRYHPRTGEYKNVGVVGPDYTVHTLPEVFGFVENLMDAGCVVETLGSLYAGKRAFLSIRTPQGVKVGDNDLTNVYFLGHTSFDGSSATTLHSTGVRVVCANTLAAATYGRNKKRTLKIRHTSELAYRVEAARELLDISFELQSDLGEIWSKLVDTSMRFEDGRDVVEQLVPIEGGLDKMAENALTTGQKRSVTLVRDTRSQILQLWQTSKTNEGNEGNAYGLLNAVTEYADHYARVQGDDKDDRRAERVVLVQNEDMKNRALELLLV